MAHSAIDQRLIRNAARSVEGLLELLIDGLEWPKPSSVDELPLLDWSPAELHLDPAHIGRLTSIKQVPRLTSSQPFGVFVLTFDGGRLPVQAVRRVVQKLIRRKRAGVHGGTAGLWDLHDLIFFCQSGESGGTLHIAAFSDGGPRPVMRVISWSAQATDTRLLLLSQTTLPDLIWPDEGLAQDLWREQWGQAFQTTYRQGVRSALQLAKSMAEVAREVRDNVRDMLPVETADGPLRSMYEDVRKGLIADLSPEDFADMYAQTMVYGLLTARITHPEDFVADARRTVLTFENPFLNAIYARIREGAADSFDTDELGLQDLAELLARTNMDEVLADFGSATRKDDPVVHFYEDFLKEYDPAQQIELGVYYTPQPVVQYQVRTVDQLLREEFGLPLGVADPTTWREYVSRVGGQVPEGVDPDMPFVSMLDPATGTGTYLVEWLRQAESNVRQEAAGRGVRGIAQDQEWARVVAKRILPQMAAFEIGLASYTVAHLKVALALPPEVRRQVRIPIYLTDTLAAPMNTGQLTLEPDPISEESGKADSVKLSRAITVVIGNPPYRERAAGRGGVVEAPSTSLTHPSLDAFREPGHGRLEFNLHNLNIYFWRWALWKALDQHPDTGGIVSFITTSPYISSGAFAGMRRYLRHNATTIRLIDCTPEGHQPDVPTRLFPGVQQTLAIMTVARRPGLVAAKDFQHASIHGSRDQKFKCLTASEPPTSRVFHGGPTDSLTPISGIWSMLPTMTQLMPFATTGLTTNRSWVISASPQALVQRWRTLLATPADQMDAVMKATRDRDSSRTFAPIPGFDQRGPLGREHQDPRLVRFSYRAFDRQYLIADSRVVDFPRPPMWQAMSDQQVFVVELHSEPMRIGPGLLFSALLPESSVFKGRGGRVLPAWRDSQGASPNLAPGLLATWAALMGPELTSDSWIRYLAGVAGTTAFFEHFREDLSVPGIRVPLTVDPAMFQRAQKLGEAALWAHTFGERGANPADLNLVDPPALPQLVRRPIEHSMPDGFTYDSKTGTLAFGEGRVDHVDTRVIDYTTSGMPVLRKWFGYRKAKPTGRASGELSEINATEWLDEWTDDLVEILTSLTWLVALEAPAADLLADIVAGPLLTLGPDGWSVSHPQKA
jgi:hypothetical protein